MIKSLLTIGLCVAVPLTGSPAVAGELKLTETDDTIRITLRDKPVLEYVKTPRPVPAGIDAHFSRSGYIHPIYSPTGEEVTGDFPADHAHQHALFFAWVKAKYDGRKVDFWNQAKQLGGVEFRGVVDVTRGEDRVSFTTKQAFTVGTGDTKVDALHETWKVTVYRTATDHYLFDIESTQRCVIDIPLVLEEYRYGGMAFRGNGQWFTAGSGDTSAAEQIPRFLTSEGKGRIDGNHSRPNWVSVSGAVDGQDVSVAVFCHPDNFRAPQHVRLHPSKPYFCFAPCVAGKFTIEPGRPYVSRYRYLVTSDQPDAAHINKTWQQYAAGP